MTTPTQLVAPCAISMLGRQFIYVKASDGDVVSPLYFVPDALAGMGVNSLGRARLFLFGGRVIYDTLHDVDEIGRLIGL